MQVYRSLEQYAAGPAPAATIGTFDGVHLGHQAILARVQAAAATQGGESVVITFHPHPRLVLRPDDTSLALLQSLDEKLERLAHMGLSKTLVIPFTREFAAWSGGAFIQRVLADTVRAQRVVIGYDHRFGSGRDGGLEALRAAGPSLGFGVEEIPAQAIDNATVSSTKIRRALEAGAVEEAARLLGYAYTLGGRVVRGRQLGRQLGYPTANLSADEPHKLLPADGIYAVSVHLLGRSAPLAGALSIGTNPTLGAGGPRTAEVYILDFEGDLYDQPLTVRFLARLRGQERFDGLPALVAQMEKDVAQVRALLGQGQ